MKSMLIRTLALTFILYICPIQAQFPRFPNLRPELGGNISPPKLDALPLGPQSLGLPTLGLDKLNFKLPLLPQAAEFLDWVNKNKADTWKVGQNFFGNISLAFLQKLGGSVIRRPYESLTGFTVLTDTKPETFKLPENFDARTKWPNCPSIREISNQRSCGSCWAIATADVMTDRNCILTQSKAAFRYSTQNLMTCCTDCGAGCDGGDPYFAYDYWINRGIVSGGYNDSYKGCQQYSIPECEHGTDGSSTGGCDADQVITPECKRACDGTYSVPYQNDLLKGQTAYNVTTVEDAMYELATKGPVNAIMQIHADFFAYKSGVYQVTNGTQSVGGHAIRIIGYGVENAVPYWLCANTWGDNWGDKGYFKVLKGKNEAEIESYILAGLPKANL